MCMVSYHGSGFDASQLTKDQLIQAYEELQRDFCDLESSYEYERRKVEESESKSEMQNQLVTLLTKLIFSNESSRNIFITNTIDLLEDQVRAIADEQINKYHGN